VGCDAMKVWKGVPTFRRNQKSQHSLLHWKWK